MESVWPAITALAGAAVGSWLTYRAKSDELKVRLVELAINILDDNPEERKSPLRDWAIRVVDRNSDEKFTAEEKEALKNKPLRGIVGQMNVTEAPDSLRAEGKVGS